MNNCKRALLWLGTTLLAISLTGCFEVSSKLKVFPSGETEMTSTIDTSRADAIGRSFNDTDSNISCEKFIEKMKQDPKWHCEQTAPSVIKAQRHYSQEESTLFMEKGSGLFSSNYKVYPAILIGPLSEDSKDASLADKARIAAMYKGLGVVMTLELEMPGEIVAIGNNKPANAAGTLTIDLLDPLVWTEGYSIQSEDRSWVKGIGLAILAVLAIATGFFVRRKSSLPENVRKFAVPVALIVALLIVVLPILLGSFFASITAPEKAKTSVAAAAPVPASSPLSAPEAPVEAPPLPPVEAPPLAPLESTSVSNWRQYVDQHPIDMMEDANLSRRFKQVLGDDYDAVKNAVTTATPTALDAGYIIATGMAPHSGGMDTAIIGIDTQNGQIYAVWRQDSQIKVYGTPHEQRLPARLYRWYKEMGGPN